MADYRIDCVNKPGRDSPHERITNVGGPKPDGSGRWKATVPDVVGYIESKAHRFFTSEAGAGRMGRRPQEPGREQLHSDPRRRCLARQPSCAEGVWLTGLVCRQPPEHQSTTVVVG